MKKVFVGLSGGVDSSVSALLLKQAGYNVVGVYMKNWSKDLPGFPCPWKEDYQDAKRIAVQLGIDFKMFDFEKEYFDKVVGYMLDGFKAGITPNPDIMCNQEIKFKLFFETAVEQGADFIATGHYARVGDSGNSKFEIRNSKNVATSNLKSQISNLVKAVDDNKDQTYFLYRVSGEALAKTLFPIGHLTKPEVRKIAEENNLVTATKKESMGICFVGKVGIKDFLSAYVHRVRPGAIVDQNGVVIGEHDGAIFYTIGQRHGLDLGGGLPYYVTGKDMSKNQVFVTTDLNDKALWSDELKLTSVHWINEREKGKGRREKLQVRTRHRAKLVDCTMTQKENGDVVLKLKDQIRAITPGQSAVIYSENICLGGGIIC